MVTSMTAVNTVKILQGSVVTQTVLGRLTIDPDVATFLWCTRVKNMKIH